MDYDFSKIRGIKQSVQENFELLLCQLLSQELNAISVDGKGGDDGIDCYTISSKGDLQIFQMKYFIQRLNPSQKNQIKSSFEKVLGNSKLKKWILCIPHDHTPAEKKWFDSLNSSSIKIEWWGETKIRNLIAKYPKIAIHFFPEDPIISGIQKIRNEINQLNQPIGDRWKNVKQPNTLPRTIPLLLGRDNEITLLRDKINKNASNKTYSVMISSIDGMPGVGKTALAVHLAHVLSPEFPDAQLFIDCYGYTAGVQPLSSESILDSLLFALGIPAQNIPKKLEEKISLWRAELASKHVIIVLDNVRTAKQVEYVLPGASKVLILITSRNRLSSLNGIYTLQLDTLNEKDSILLLQEIISDNLSNSFQEILPEIAKLCGYLPLALNIIAARLRRRDFRYAKFILNKLRNNHKRISSLRTRELSINTIFDLSYSSFSNYEKEMFKIMGLHPGLNFTIGACAAMLNISIDTASEFLETLIDESFVLETDLGRYRLHDLLRDYSRQKYTDENILLKEDIVVRRLLDYYLLILKHTNEILYPNQFRMQIIIAHQADDSEKPIDVESALTWFNREIDNLFACLEFAKERKWTREYWQLSHSMANYLKRSIPSWRVIEVHNQAIIFSELFEGLEEKASSLTELAWAQREAGDFKIAIKNFCDAENHWRILKNENGLAYSLNGHGFTLERLGLYSEALLILGEALDLYEKSNNKYGEAFTLNATGAVYWRQEEYKTALSFFENAFEIRKEIDDTMGTASTINNMAFTHLKLGNIKKATGGFVEALKIYKSYNDFHGQAVVLNNFGHTSLKLNKFKSAIKYSINARELATTIGDSYQIGRSFEVEGKAFLGQKKYIQASKVLHVALNVYKDLNVPETKEIQSILKQIKGLS